MRRKASLKRIQEDVEDILYRELSICHKLAFDSDYRTVKPFLKWYRNHFLRVKGDLIERAAMSVLKQRRGGSRHRPNVS